MVALRDSYTYARQPQDADYIDPSDSFESDAQCVRYLGVFSCDFTMKL